MMRSRKEMAVARVARALRRCALGALIATVAACAADSTAGPPPERAAEDGAARAEVPAAALPVPRLPETTLCRRFVNRLAEAAERNPDSAEGFVTALNDEFTGGTHDPFEMKEGLRTGEWDQAWFYAGHGGFRAEYDDAQRYPNGGNHQPGHFVAVLSIATLYGADAAEVAIAYAGDYEPGDEDDLRLSRVAIRYGGAMQGGAMTPPEVARAASELCR